MLTTHPLGKQSTAYGGRRCAFPPYGPAVRIAKGERGIWQRRYWEHTIRDELDYARHVDYVHFNPVKHGFVARVSDWPYSSFSRFVDAGVHPIDWVLRGVWNSPPVSAIEPPHTAEGAALFRPTALDHQ